MGIRAQGGRRASSFNSLFPIRYSLAAVLVASVGGQALAQERPAAFVDVATVVPGSSSRPAMPVRTTLSAARSTVTPPRCLLDTAAAQALAGVAQDVAKYGLVIKVFDCYRPMRAVANFVRWARDLDDIAGKAEFYPDVDKRTLFRAGYISPRSGHSRGSTIDLTLARSDGRELDMGTPFDFFSPKSSPLDGSIGLKAIANRGELSEAMRHHGFRSYEKEWWHFTPSHEPFPNTYFDFPVK